MLENAAMVQLTAEAAGDPAPEFPRADIEKLKHDIARPERFPNLAFLPIPADWMRPGR